ncbi:MAG: GNAT family N-acetyltransferase [Terriglobales bacterium]
MSVITKSSTAAAKPKNKSERIRIYVDKATLHDVSGIHSVLLANKRDSQLYQRSRADIQRNLRDFYVATDEKGKLMGCVAIHFHTPTYAEILSLAVAPGCQGKGIGPRLLEQAENAALERHAETIWLICQKPEYFERLGFKRISPFKLPTSMLMKKFRETLDQPFSRWLPNLLGRMKFMIMLPRKT